jgi:protein-S-isoprenylcysteine O-methyltransferase Ste14/uncharacterized membrane protein (UPF0127 family)
MPIKNLTRETTYAFGVVAADRMLARLVGLLGTAGPDPEKALYIVPCSGIHTFGMKYPIDVLFLSKEGRVIRVEHRLESGKIVKPVLPVKSVLELPAGAVREFDIRLNDCLQVVPDCASRPDLRRMGNLLHWPMNAFIAFLWSRFVLAALNGLASSANLLNFGIVAHNTLLMCFFLLRRNSITISSRVLDWVIPVLTLCGALLLRPVAWDGGGSALVSEWLQVAGLTGIIFSLMSLGKSFGIVPANRKVVCAGAYRIVRHPLYLSEMVFYVGFLSGNASPRNVLLVLMVLAGQLYRSVSEERLLALDSSYRSYKQRVRYRFIPGLF